MHGSSTTRKPNFLPKMMGAQKNSLKCAKNQATIRQLLHRQNFLVMKLLVHQAPLMLKRKTVCKSTQSKSKHKRLHKANDKYRKSISKKQFCSLSLMNKRSLSTKHYLYALWIKKSDFPIFVGVSFSLFLLVLTTLTNMFNRNVWQHTVKHSKDFLQEVLKHSMQQNDKSFCCQRQRKRNSKSTNHGDCVRL